MLEPREEEVPETTASQRFIFTGRTVDELRNELNRFVDQISKELQVDTLRTKGVVFTPVEGPQRKADAQLGLVFLRKEQFESGDGPLHIVRDYLGVRQLILPGTWATATYNGVVGGLTD